MKTIPNEYKAIASLYRRLRTATEDHIPIGTVRALHACWKKAYRDGNLEETPGVHPLQHCLETALMMNGELGMQRSSVLCSTLNCRAVLEGLDYAQVEKDFGASAVKILKGLHRVAGLSDKNTSVATENFRNLLLSFAEDARVILILIAEQVNRIRHIDDYPEAQREGIAHTAGLLYAPLAHRMGLYSMKTELEDLTLKFTQPVVYEEITRKLAESKDVREAYIKRFIQPIRERLEANLSVPFEIKGRTKSVHSIWNKIRKKQISFEDIYDIFAIRVIIDAPPEKEKALCWLAYSLVTDMYQPNPARTRDWLSIPKSNGYESLHTTVLGPEDKWVEVQIRTERMNEVAEKGLAAHWRYKGIKSEKGLDEMLTRVREMLEDTGADGGLSDSFKMELFGDEIYIFSPKGELYKLPQGATVLDFAYSIHTNLGNRCVGAKVNDRNVPIRYKLRSGDQVSIQTGANQSPKQDWLNYVVTSRARNKIRQTLKENLQKQAEFGRENLMRRLKNRHLEFDEANVSRLVKYFKRASLTEFYAEIGEGRLDCNEAIDALLELQAKDAASTADANVLSASNFEYSPEESAGNRTKDDVLVIDQNLRGLEFRLAKCCNPIYGDEVFGFVTVGGGIRVHRVDCPNAPQMRLRYGYRMVRARWAGQGEGSQYTVTLQVIGKDDIGIVTNITSLISKENNVAMRSIRIDSTDGLFRGFLSLTVSGLGQLDALIKKIQTVKGVKQVIRE